ncbi:YwqG family protein [Bacillus solimangrovi]
MSKLHLPVQLETFRNRIEKTVKPFIEISVAKDITTIHQSKFVGNPYLPKAIEHPKDEEGKPMKLLAQLNFDEIPHIEFMPPKGILQFFISAEDDVMGINFDNMTNQSNFRVLYHSEVIKDETLLVTDFSYMENLDTEYFPIEHELALSFSLEHEPISYGDFRSSELIGKSFSEIMGEDDEELEDVYERFSGEGHKIGGYPFFTQTDPREYELNFQEHNILLLQIDTHDDMGIMWGDSGVANFFIRKEDLKKLDFSNVIYNWDCH